MMFILIRVWATKPYTVKPLLDITPYLDFWEAKEYLIKHDAEKLDAFLDWLEQRLEIGEGFRFNDNLSAFINLSS